MIPHLVQFAFITLVASLVYHALREDDLGKAARMGARRFVSFLVLGAAFGLVIQLFSRWL